MIMINVELDFDQCTEITRNTLLDLVENDPITTDELKESIHRTIAYLSVPGEYMNGKYDSNY